MKYQYQSQGYKNDFYGYKNQFKLSAINLIIAINIVIFFLFSNTLSNSNIFYLSPNNFYVWQLVTYMFLHGSINHLLFNMFLLWMFGTQMESIWGFKKFIIYYLFTGVGSGFLIYIFGNFPTLGASGAIMAVLFAYGYIFPNQKVLFWFVPMQVKYCILILIGYELFMEFLDAPNDQTSHIGHLGGMLIGYLYLKFSAKFLKLFFNLFQIKIKKKTKSQSKRKNKIKNIDKILDKLKLEGWEGLDEREKSTLFEASKKKKQNHHIN